MRRRSSLRRVRSVALAGGLLLVAGASFPAGAAAEVVPNPNPATIARWEPCEPDTGVTVIVDRQNRLGDGKIEVGCALGEQETGLDALHNAGFTTEGVGGGYAFVCRINGQPTVAEDACAQTPGGCCYWSYWHGKPGGIWGYSGVGAANPLSRAPVNSIEGWGFGGLRPRIYPMDGSGPSSFTLPPPQESSAVPLALARKWLRGAAVGTAELAQAPGSGVGVDDEETLTEAVALSRSGVEVADLAPIASMFESLWESNGVEYSRLLAYANDGGSIWGIDPESPEFPLYGSASDYALAIVGLAALGKDPTDFAGHDLRADLIAKIDVANGKIRNKQSGSPVTKSAELFQTAPTVWALALTGAFPEEARKTVGLVLDAQDPATGAFGSGAPVFPIEALAAARDAGATGLDEPIEKAADYLEGLQEGDGGIRRAPGSQPADDPTFKLTAGGAVALALAGHPAAAEKAAKWVSRYQLTAEYVGTPDPVTGDPALAEPLIGAFLSEEGEMRNAIVNGLSLETVPHGIYPSARLPTAQALEALVAAGPYGPHSASLSQESLWFGKQTVGTQGTAQTATLTNEDERPLSIAAVELIGAQAGDFALDGSDCLARTLTSGQSCELAARFVPTAVGVREGVVEVELTGGGSFELSLGGTGFPAPVTKPGPAGDPDPLPAPLLDPAPPLPESDSIAPFRARQSVTGRVLRVARLSCPAGASCQVRLPRRVGVRIAGKLYRVAVLSPPSLEGGKTATVRVQLPRDALAALAGHHAVVRLTVEILTASGVATRTVRVRVEAAA